MGFFDFLHTPDINQGVKEYHDTPKAILLDVRTAQEYQGGHIPGSQNLPLQAIEQIGSIVEEKEMPLFVYCRSGQRSRQSEQILRKMGYTRVKNIGGILDYTGKVE